MLRRSAIAILSLVLQTGPGFAQDESQPPPESTEETPTEEAPGDSEADQEPDAETAEPQLTPEEQAKIEQARRKREMRKAKREAKRAEEAEKAAEKAAKQEAQHQEHLARLLEKGDAALEAGEYKNALQIFQNHLELERGRSFAARMGLARTQLALGNAAEAVEQALKAAKVAKLDSDGAAALIFAGQATLDSRPRDEATFRPLPGTEIYETTALRFYLRAIVADPDGAEEARQRLADAFPTPQDETIDRLYKRYLELAPGGPILHAKRLAAAYEALISGAASTHVVVAGGITAPVKVSGKRPPYPQEESGKNLRRRLVAGLLVEADGSVSKVEVLNGIDPALDARAGETFMTWTFEPARLPNGEPVPVHHVVAVNAILVSPELASPEPAGSKSSPDQGDPESDQ